MLADTKYLFLIQLSLAIVVSRRCCYRPEDIFKLNVIEHQPNNIPEDLNLPAPVKLFVCDIFKLNLFVKCV